MIKVLVVDDVVMVSKTIAKMIEPIGCCCIFATDGEKALSILEDNRDIRCLITDYKMPRLDGGELIQRLKEQDRYKDLPIILTSGHVTVKEISKMLKAGVARFFPKPVNKRDLEEYLVRYVFPSGKKHTLNKTSRE